MAEMLAEAEGLFAQRLHEGTLAQIAPRSPVSLGVHGKT